MRQQTILSPQAGRCPLCLQPALPAAVATQPSRELGALAQPVVHDEAARHGDVEARLVRVRDRVMVRVRDSVLVSVRVFGVPECMLERASREHSREI